MYSICEVVWTLPIELELVPVGQTPAAFGAEQIARFVSERGWEPDELLAVDADYTKVPVLRPMVGAGANVLGRSYVADAFARRRGHM